MMCVYSVASVMSNSLGFSRQEYWSGSPFPPPGESSQTQGLNPSLLRWQVDLLLLSHGEVHRVEPPKAGLIKTQPWDFPDGLTVKSLSANTGNTGSIPGPGRLHMPQGHQTHVPKAQAPRSPCSMQQEKPKQ